MLLFLKKLTVGIRMVHPANCQGVISFIINMMKIGGEGDGLKFILGRGNEEKNSKYFLEFPKSIPEIVGIRIQINIEEL